MTVVILVARGTMDTQVNRDIFHGARVTDLRRCLEFMRGAQEGLEWSFGSHHMQYEIYVVDSI